MQSDLGSQARLKPAELMGPFPIQMECVLELRVHGFHHLADLRHPALEPLGPLYIIIRSMRSKELDAIGLPLHPMIGRSLKAFVHHIRPYGRRSYAKQPRVGLTAQGKKGVCQRLVLST